MNDQDPAQAALALARNAIAERAEQALAPILRAIDAIAHTGTAEQFREIEELLDRETFASGRYAATIRPLLEALSVAEVRQQRKLVACIERRLGWVYDFAGDDVAALEMSQRARENFEALGEDEGLVRSLSDLGVLWTRRGDLQEAARVLGLALAQADRGQMLTERARVRVNLGHVCDLLGEYDRGRQLLEESFALSALLTNHAAQMGALLNLARIDLAQRKPEQAAATLLRVEPLVASTGNHFAQIEAWLIRGRIALQQGRFDDATACFSSGIAMAQETGAPREEKELWQAASESHVASGNYRAAFETAQRVAAMDDQLRRERAVLQAATAAERRAAEQAQREALEARARELALRETFEELQRTQNELLAANEEKDQRVAELHRQSREDALTGLLNRRALDAELARECSRAERHVRPLALVLLDVDNFKRINDTRSHAVGDAVLVAIARQLQQARRKSDIVARLGGEELVMALPETSLDQGFEVCAQLRAALADVDWSAVGVDAPVTVSIGLATARPNESPHALLARADALMYRAKAEGRDRVCRDD